MFLLYICDSYICEARHYEVWAASLILLGTMRMSLSIGRQGPRTTIYIISSDYIQWLITLMVYDIGSTSGEDSG